VICSCFFESPSAEVVDWGVAIVAIVCLVRVSVGAYGIVSKSTATNEKSRLRWLSYEASDGRDDLDVFLRSL
jgi:hypothetical protein